MTILFSNNASSTVAGSITATDTTVALAAGTGVLFPGPTGGDYFCATFYDQATKTQNEIVHVTSRAGDICTIVRAQEGTVAQAWNAADIFANLVTAGTLEAFVQAGTGPADTSVVYVGTDVSTTPGLVVAATNPVPPNLATGMLFNIKIANGNPGPVQCQFNGGTAIRASRTDGSNMVGGNLVASEEMMFIFNGVDFTSIVPPIPQQPPQTTFYVRPDGNDSNTGFANTPQAAFATISGAINQIEARYISQNVITIRVADGHYIDGFETTSQYIAGWDVIGDTNNPQNVIIDATSVNSAAYPSPYATPGASCGAYNNSNLTVQGMSFLSYLGSCVANGGSVDVWSCVFNATIIGEPTIQCITSKMRIFGNNTCSIAAPNGTFIGVYDGGNIGMGWSDGISSLPCSVNVVNGSQITNCTVEASGCGSITIDTTVTTFTGFVPNCRQYVCESAGGITFVGGNTTIFPGAQPGLVQAPGWING